MRKGCASFTEEEFRIKMAELPSQIFEALWAYNFCYCLAGNITMNFESYRDI